MEKKKNLIRKMATCRKGQLEIKKRGFCIFLGCAVFIPGLFEVSIKTGGADEIRTRDLLRDREAL